MRELYIQGKGKMDCEGILGMLLAVPLFSVVFTLLKEHYAERMAGKSDDISLNRETDHLKALYVLIFFCFFQCIHITGIITFWLVHSLLKLFLT